MARCASRVLVRSPKFDPSAMYAIASARRPTTTWAAAERGRDVRRHRDARHPKRGKRRAPIWRRAWRVLRESWSVRRLSWRRASRAQDSRSRLSGATSPEIDLDRLRDVLFVRMPTDRKLHRVQRDLDVEALVDGADLPARRITRRRSPRAATT
jgi:hypothetical protein